MIDPVASQVKTAEKYGTFETLVGDARTLDFPDDSFDAVLLAGPLYHLVGRTDRIRALSEARRVCRPGGFVHAAAIPRFSAIAVAILPWKALNPAPDAVLDLIRRGDPAAGRFPAGHFHTSEELHEELVAAELSNVSVVGLEGPAGLALETVTKVSEEDFQAAKRLAVLFQDSSQIRDLSCHVLGTGQV
ncbi:SAM-dependent methyltransferase [Nakamurella sp. UYEF19]